MKKNNIKILKKETLVLFYMIFSRLKYNYKKEVKLLWFNRKKIKMLKLKEEE